MKFFPFVFIPVLLALSGSMAVEATGDAAGEWNAENSPYIVVGDIRMADGDELKYLKSAISRTSDLVLPDLNAWRERNIIRKPVGFSVITTCRKKCHCESAFSRLSNLLTS